MHVALSNKEKKSEIVCMHCTIECEYYCIQLQYYRQWGRNGTRRKHSPTLFHTNHKQSQRQKGRQKRTELTNICDKLIRILYAPHQIIAMTNLINNEGKTDHLQYTGKMKSICVNQNTMNNDAFSFQFPILNCNYEYLYLIMIGQYFWAWLPVNFKMKSRTL